MDSVLRPRDIQARIRAGEAPETVAAAAQTSVDKIMGFATPVLAERAYQAQLAQRASVRRRAATGHVGNLGTAVTTHLESLDVDPDAVEWDAWRREDGRWTVVAEYPARGEDRRAVFTYDAAGRFVVADDEEARTLVGERSAAVPEPERPTHPSSALREVPGLLDTAGSEPPVPDAVDELRAAREPREHAGQLPLGDDAIDLVTGGRPVVADRDIDWIAQPAAEADLEREVTIDLTETSASVRSAPRAGTGDADWISTQASDRPAPPPAPQPATQPATQPAPPPDGAPQSQPWDTPGDGRTAEGDAREEEQEEAETLFEVPQTEEQVEPSEPSAAAEPADRPARVSRARGRASVPSWDEIMFGTPKSE